MLLGSGLEPDAQRTVQPEAKCVHRPPYPFLTTAETGRYVGRITSRPSGEAFRSGSHKEIQGITNKPVRKIVNTHFHWDHWQGNQVYASANPGLEIVASQRTRENLTRPDAGVGGIPFIEKQLTTLPKEIDQLKDEITRATSPEVKARLESNLHQAEAYLQELKGLKPALPTRTLTSTVTLHEQGREIQLHLLGRAHTDGDVFVYLPREKVVVTGDAVIDWMPFLNDGYPEDWVQTLTALEQLDFTRIIPGHGVVLPKSHLTFFRGYLSDLIAAVKKAAADGASLDEMKKAVGDQLAPKYERGMSKYPLGQYRDPRRHERRDGLPEGGQEGVSMRRTSTP